MRPKFLLWIAVGLVSAAWYLLDPAARSTSDGLPPSPGEPAEQADRAPDRGDAPAPPSASLDVAATADAVVLPESAVRTSHRILKSSILGTRGEY